MRVHQLSQRFLVDDLNLVQVVVQCKLLMQEFPQGVHKGQATVEILIINITDLVGNRGTSTLG
jgi:hypothetical protein